MKCEYMEDNKYCDNKAITEYRGQMLCGKHLQKVNAKLQKEAESRKG